MSGIPGVLQRSGDQVIHDLVQSGHGVDLDLNQITIERINTVSYGDREVMFAIKAREVGVDGSRPVYSGQTSVIYDRFVGDNYFSKYPHYIQLDAPYTLGRVVAALNAQTELHWDLDDFQQAADFVLAVSPGGTTLLTPSQHSKRLYLELSNTRLTVVITPVNRVHLARVLPPAVLQPSSEYFKYTDPRANLSLRLPDANGVAVGGVLKHLVAGQIIQPGDNVDWMTVVYGRADGLTVAWVSEPELAAYNLCESRVTYNGLLTDDIPKPYNTRLDRVLVFELSEEHCSNYYGRGIIYYNLSRDGEP